MQEGLRERNDRRDPDLSDLWGRWNVSRSFNYEVYLEGGKINWKAGYLCRVGEAVGTGTGTWVPVGFRSACHTWGCQAQMVSWGTTRLCPQWRSESRSRRMRRWVPEASRGLRTRERKFWRTEEESGRLQMERPGPGTEWDSKEMRTWPRNKRRETQGSATLTSPAVKRYHSVTTGL